MWWHFQSTAHSIYYSSHKPPQRCWLQHFSQPPPVKSHTEMNHFTGTISSTKMPEIQLGVKGVLEVELDHPQGSLGRGLKLAGCPTTTFTFLQQTRRKVQLFKKLHLPVISQGGRNLYSHGAGHASIDNANWTASQCLIVILINTNKKNKKEGLRSARKLPHLLSESLTAWKESEPSAKNPHYVKALISAFLYTQCSIFLIHSFYTDLCITQT